MNFKNIINENKKELIIVLIIIIFAFVSAFILAIMGGINYTTDKQYSKFNLKSNLETITDEINDNNEQLQNEGQSLQGLNDELVVSNNNLIDEFKTYKDEESNIQTNNNTTSNIETVNDTSSQNIENPITNSNQYQEDKAVPDTSESFILNTNTKKFHLPNCKHASTIKDSNKHISYSSREALINQGYTPCKSCNP